MWDPPLDGAGYYRELGRLARMNRLAQNAGATVESSGTLEQEIAVNGSVEIGGHRIHERLYHSTVGLSLQEMVPPRGSRVLLVQFGRAEPSAQLMERTAGWGLAHSALEAVAVAETEVWWFARNDIVEDDRPLTRDTIATTLSFFESIPAAREETKP
jgi:hypothetical protein